MSYLDDYGGWVGNVFLILAALLLGGKSRRAFLFTALGEAVWCVVTWRIGRWDMLCICLTFGVLAIVNWWRWRPIPEEPS